MASLNGKARPLLGAEDLEAISSMIKQQLEAFQHDDAETAFSFASPGIQEMFGTPQHFLDMVRESYQPVYRPRNVEFLDLVEHEGQPAQKVLLIGPDGQPVTALYLLQKQPDGQWRINGCILFNNDA